MTSPESLTAQTGDHQTLPASPGSSPLHQSAKACGKKWLKKAGRLTPEQLTWMLRQSHQLYTVTANQQRLLTIEVLSTPSFRNCDVEKEWNRRETTVRVTYFLADGTTAVKLHHFARDETFFNQAPKVYAPAGRALLRGVTVNGHESNRWLNLELLVSLLADQSRWASPEVAPPDATATPTLRLASLRLR
jgi:hypothetical protein